MTPSESNPYPRIKAYEQGEFDRLSGYLQGLDPAGWVEQSYCTDWRVYQAVSHIGSGSRIGALRLKAWTADGPPANREAMQQVWGFFDSLQPDGMLAAYSAAAGEYLDAEAGTPDVAGLQEVDGFAGRRPIYAYQLGRVWELALHAWDIYVSRERAARLDPAAVALLAPWLHFMNLPLDRERAATLATKPIVVRLSASRAEYTLDPTAERPRLAQGAAPEAPLVIEGPDEEIIRLLAGRDYIPGTQPAIRLVAGSPTDLSSFKRALR